MQEQEIKKIIAVMINAYPNYKPNNVELMVEIWNDMLSEYTYHQVAMALKAYITTDTSGFAPNLGQLIAKIHDIADEPQINEMEAWALVRKALRNGYYGAEQEYAKLPEIVQKVVGSASNLRSWAQMNIESVENVIQNNFTMSYRAVLQREKEHQKLQGAKS